METCVSFEINMLKLNFFFKKKVFDEFEFALVNDLKIKC